MKEVTDVGGYKTGSNSFGFDSFGLSNFTRFLINSALNLHFEPIAREEGKKSNEKSSAPGANAKFHT